MSSMDRFVRWLSGEEGGEPSDSARAASRALDASGLPALSSNAEAYGVTVDQIAPSPGTRYWRLTEVHHLSPEENNGRHHIYINAQTIQGERAFNSQARVTWEGGEQIVTLDKPINEPATNFPLFKWQVCSVEMLGMPSDKAHGISSSHPDEPGQDGSIGGNTLFHHSFRLEFQEVIVPQAVTTGSIQGRVENSRDGLRVALVQGDSEVASAAVAGDGTFTFADVKAGGYTVRLEEQQIPVQMVAGETAQVVLTLAATESVIEGQVHGGSGLRLRLVEAGEVVAEGALTQSGVFRLRNLGAGIYHLQVLRPGETEPLVKSGALAMDGRNTRTVELRLAETAPEPTPDPTPDPTPAPVAPSSGSGSPLEHYVLLPSTDTPQNRALVAAILPRLAEKKLAFGFNYQEAARSKEVTVIGDGRTIPEFQMIYLFGQGVKARRLVGTPEEIAGQL